MYYAIVHQNVLNGFRELSKGNYKPITSQMSPQIYLSFVGNHAMGGEYRGLLQVTQWFERVLRLFPGIQFDIKSVTVGGMPWNTTVTTRFKVRATLRDGRQYENEAMQFLRIKWGKIVEDIVFEDTHKLIVELQRMAAENGVAEAIAAPVGIAA
jgi:ketosteroid isomerase-like protein